MLEIDYYPYDRNRHVGESNSQSLGWVVEEMEAIIAALKRGYRGSDHYRDELIRSFTVQLMLGIPEKITTRWNGRSSLAERHMVTMRAVWKRQKGESRGKLLRERDRQQDWLEDPED